MQILSTHQLDIGYVQRRSAERRVASQIGLSLDKGEFVCLLGPNGIGKSTLLRTLAGAQKPLAGRVEIEGKALNQLSSLEIARKCSVVLTERVESNLSVYALVAMGRYPYTGFLGNLQTEDEAKIRWAIEVTGSSSYAHRPVYQLSDGERQKVMIARALAQDTPIILLDEPTAHLDLSNRVEIIRLLRGLSRDTQKAILLSTHDLDLAIQAADRIWLMDSPTSIQVGTPEDLILSDALEAMFRTEGFSFDKRNGTFRLHSESIGSIHLAGTGNLSYWVRRALERVGFQVIETDTLEGDGIEILPNAKTPLSYTYKGQQGSCESIEQLLTSLLVS